MNAKYNRIFAYFYIGLAASILSFLVCVVRPELVAWGTEAGAGQEPGIRQLLTAAAVVGVAVGVAAPLCALAFEKALLAAWKTAALAVMSGLRWL
ncbi:MAG TPA: hypothetical protein VFQ72_04270 [Candidatus Paceibacterota bacterium]|nr:hypothetical protein [Candidatus Paceibacterota bacterium]